MGKFKDWQNKILDRDSPAKITKRQAKKMAFKKMGGETKKDRFTNFFTNRTGYYSWKEMMVNYLIVISLLMTIAAVIVSIIFRDKFNILTLQYNAIFICLVCAMGFLFMCLISKIRCRKHRFECFINNGNTTKYVFWKDDRFNPANKYSHQSFE